MMQTEEILGLNPKGFHRLSCAVWGRGKGDVPVICVHGLTRNGRDFDRLAARLSETRAVYCPDMAGRGRSDDLPDAFGYHLTQYMADCTAIIARTGASQVHWVGTSMGGLIGMMLAAQPNSPIRRLVLNDVGPVIEQAALKRIGHYMGGDQPAFADVSEAEAYLRKIYAPFGALSDEDWRDMAMNGTRTRLDGQLTLAHDPHIADTFSVATKDLNLWSSYDKITCPTLLIRGADSDLLSPEVAEAMSRRGPRASLYVVQGAGHAPALRAQDQIQRINDFLWDEA